MATDAMPSASWERTRFEPRTRLTSPQPSSLPSTSPARFSSSPSTVARPPPPSAKASTFWAPILLRAARPPDVEHGLEQSTPRNLFDLRGRVHARDDVLD